MCLNLFLFLGAFRDPAVQGLVLVLSLGVAAPVAGSETDAGPTTPPVEAPTIDPAAAGQLVPPTITSTLRNQLGFAFPDAPDVPEGPADEDLEATIDGLFATLRAGKGVDVEALQRIGGSGDARAAWILTDIWRFLGPSLARDVLQAGFVTLTGAALDEDPVSSRSTLQSATDHLIAWNLPALPDYERWKGDLYTLVDPRWGAFFEDEGSEIDWRPVSWGGVYIDDRPFGETGPCRLGCIPALDDPLVVLGGMALLVALWALGFGYLSRRFELEADGATIHWIDPADDGLADSVFTYDPSFTIPQGVVVMRPGKSLRVDEAALHARFYRCRAHHRSKRYFYLR